MDIRCRSPSASTRGTPCGITILQTGGGGSCEEISSTPQAPDPGTTDLQVVVVEVIDPGPDSGYVCEMTAKALPPDYFDPGGTPSDDFTTDGPPMNEQGSAQCRECASRRSDNREQPVKRGLRAARFDWKGHHDARYRSRGNCAAYGRPGRSRLFTTRRSRLRRLSTPEPDVSEGPSPGSSLACRRWHPRGRPVAWRSPSTK